MEIKHFNVQEFVFPELYDVYGDESIQFISKNIILTAIQLREIFGVMYINTWLFGGDLKYRGLRPYDCPIGALKSSHKTGKAIDFHFKNATTEEVREYILKNRFSFPLVNRMEMDTDTWIHLDHAGIMQDQIVMFKG